MFDYFEPLRVSSPSGIWDLPFVVGFYRKDNTVIFFKGYSAIADHNPVTINVVGEKHLDDGGVEFSVDTGADVPSTVVFHRLTTDYILANKQLYPFNEKMLTSLLTSGNLSLFAQATIPEWYEKTYPPDDK